MALTPLALPSDDWLTWLDERGSGQLRAARDRVAELTRAEPGSHRILELWNETAIALRNAGGVAGLLSSVHPDAALIERAEAIEVEVQRYSTDLHLDTDVFRALRSVDPDGLDDDARRMLAKSLQDFHRSGVDRDDDVREQVRRLEARLTDLGQTFSRNIRDGRLETRVPAAALTGLPDDYVEAHQPGDDGLVAISTDYPDVLPFLTFSTDAAARRAVAATSLRIAYPDNDPVLAELLQVRHELATLLGYSGWPDYDAEVKMIGSGNAIAAFIDTVSAAAASAGEREIGILRERAAADGEPVIDGSNWRHFSEIIKRAAIMKGVIPDPYDGPQLSAAEAEAERLLQAANEKP